MTVFGEIDSSDKTQGKWDTYVEHFFLANNIDGDHQAQTLLSFIWRQNIHIVERSSDTRYISYEERLGVRHNPSTTLVKP